MEHVLSLSYGKDSLACLGAIEELGWPLERIVHAEVWATDTIPADLPTMVEFKEKADAIIWKRLGIHVEHVRSEYTAERMFYRKRKRGNRKGQIAGFPMVNGPKYGCELQNPLKKIPMKRFQSGNVVYLGIAADEPKRFHNLREKNKSPLVEAGWTESTCRKWCEENDLLSPIYTDSARGGCWFCPNQSVQQLRLLRKNYPEYWALMLKWDADSPVQFKPGHTVHDYERRFQLEDDGIISPDDKVFRWSMLDECLNYRLF